MAIDRSAFRFGGRLSLDLTWTIAGRSFGFVDLLATHEGLATWFVEVRLLPHPPLVSDALLNSAVELRGAVYAVAAAIASGRSPNSDDVAVVNRVASGAPLTPQLDADDLSLRYEATDPGEAALAVVARDAVELFGDDHLRQRIRQCARDECLLVFVDASRPGRRRWCSTKDCGNLVNTARYRQRRGGGA